MKLGRLGEPSDWPWMKERGIDTSWPAMQFWGRFCKVVRESLSWSHGQKSPVSPLDETALALPSSVFGWEQPVEVWPWLTCGDEFQSTAARPLVNYSSYNWRPVRCILILPTPKIPKLLVLRNASLCYWLDFYLKFLSVAHAVSGEKCKTSFVWSLVKKTWGKILNSLC